MPSVRLRMPCGLGPGEREKAAGDLSPPPPDIVRARGLSASNGVKAAQAAASGLGALLRAALLRLRLVGCRHDLDQLDRAAGGLDRLAGAGGGAGDAEGELG